MAKSYEQFQAKLADPELPHHERQSAEAALSMLRELMVNKTRDVRRRLRETHKY